MDFTQGFGIRHMFNIFIDISIRETPLRFERSWGQFYVRWPWVFLHLRLLDPIFGYFLSMVRMQQFIFIYPPPPPHLPYN